MLAAASAVGLGMSAAHAQKGVEAPVETVRQLSTDLIGGMLDGHALQYNVTRDSYDDPYIEIITGKSLPARSMGVVFHDCDAADRCEDVMLTASFNLRGPGLDLINGWNATTRWTRAYLADDQSAVLELDINATGGIGIENVEIMVNTYLAVLEEFAATLNQ